MQVCFIVGSKGFGNYGGYETFVDKLTEYHKNNKEIKYFVACKNRENSIFTHNNATGFNIKVPNIGAVQAIYYDVKAIQWCIKYIKDNHVEHPIVYILACRIGPYANYFKKKIHKLGGKLYLNPDGHEWMRAKWSFPVRKYWKLSEQMLVKHSDLLVCDSRNIEKYIHDEYSRYNPQTTFIAYGSDITFSSLANDDPRYTTWMSQKKLRPQEYYLVVGRFVPENNYEFMISEFMKSKSKKDFAIITTSNDKFLGKLEEKLHFKADSRIKFVGTVYNQQLLQKIRKEAYGYLHGHEVGGTNPSLLEALGNTRLNLLLDVGFNREVAEDTALYWKKKQGDLTALIECSDLMTETELNSLELKAKQRIQQAYSWQFIADRYAEIFKSN